MRTILIIQSAIIILGAYYIFTLHQGGKNYSKEDSPLPAVYKEISNDKVEDKIENEIATSSDDLLNNEEVTDFGHDQGMEYPIFDGELEVR